LLWPSRVWRRIEQGRRLNIDKEGVVPKTAAGINPRTTPRRPNSARPNTRMLRLDRTLPAQDNAGRFHVARVPRYGGYHVPQAPGPRRLPGRLWRGVRPGARP